MIKIQNHPLKYLLLVLLLLSMSQQISKNKKPAQKTLVEDNHFESTTQRKAIYTINKVQTNKSLVLLLKDQDNQSGKLNNQLTITLISGQQTVQCTFQKLTDLCIVPLVESPDFKMNIECSHLPCSVTWIIYQPQPVSPQKKQFAQNLYTLQKSSNHLLGEITCNDPAITSLDEDTTIYSNSNYVRSYVNNIIYIMFNNEEKGYVFVNINQRSMACAIISYYSVPSTIAPSDTFIKDFVLKESKSSFDIDQVPKGEFRVECSISKVDRNMEVKPNLIVGLYGLRENQMELLAEQNIKAISKTNVVDFSYIFKQVSDAYTKLKLVFNSDSNQMIIINVRFVVQDIQIIDLGEAAYFNLKQGEKISFKIIADQDANDEQTNYIVRKRQDQINVTKSECKAKEDCQFEVEALVDTANMIYISAKKLDSAMINKEGKGSYEFQQIQFVPINRQAKHYLLRMGDNLYFKKAAKKGKAFRVFINNPNALLYASSADKCEVPNQKCRQRTGNYHHPFSYTPDKDGDFLINVQGLDNGEFVLSVIEQADQFIPLQDGVSFSYTMDSSQKSIDFKCTIKQKADVSFNLIAPLNTLKLIVSNQDKNIDDYQASQQSSDGYIIFEKDRIDGLTFVISVVKANQNSDYFTHFTLIASSSTANLRLEPTVTYYQTLKTQTSKDFVFEFDPSQNYILSFYVYNQKDKNIHLQLQLTEKSDNWQQAETIIIDKQADYVNLKDISESLCYEEGVDSCEIFMRISNLMEVEVDISLTLLMSNAIIELKDGIWQAYPQIYTTATFSFYFYPRHITKNIFLYYHSAYSMLKLSYRLWKFRKDEINPSEWPFPLHLGADEKLYQNYKTSNYIQIDHEQMKSKCWPNCVLLVSLYIQGLSQLLTKPTLDVYTQFRIMVSNNQVELPEKQKLSFSLGKGEDKDIFIDLKYLMQKEYVKFFITSTIGQCIVRATVFEEGNNHCPSEDSVADFQIYNGQSIILINELNQKIKQKNVEEGKKVYMCVGVHSQTSCKMSIEYTGESDGFKRIQTDTFQEITLGNNQTKLYKVDGYSEQFAKITRLKGFPFVAIKRCEKFQTLKECQDSFIKQGWGKQIVVKTEQFHDDPCAECVFLFKFSSLQPSQVRFHLQSRFGQLELTQNVILFDFLNEAQVNRYIMHSVESEDTIVNIHVQQGRIEAQVVNFNGERVSKVSNLEQKILHFLIKGVKAAENNKSNNSKALLNPFALSKDFSVSHLQIKSADVGKAACYTVVYSSGQRQIYLQDGLILDYILQPSKQSVFYYVNEIANSHIYLSLSMPQVQMLNKLSMKVYYYEDINDEETKKEFRVDKPPMSKKAPNPTLVISLPSQNYFMIVLNNPTNGEQKVSLGINHQQVLLLPFNTQFPFLLHKSEELNVLVDVNNAGFLSLQIKKCDKSEPLFGYTFNYDSFIKSEFMYATKLNQEPRFEYLIKANRIGTLYMNFKANSEQDTLLSIKINYSETKSTEDKLKISKRGGIVYELSNERIAKITFPIAQCSNKPCSGITYYYMSSNVQQQLYSQLVCSSSFFTVPELASTNLLQLHQITGKEANGQITFSYEVVDKLSYLGIKAISKTGEEVYYNPVEIATLFAKWSSVNLLYKLTIAGVLASGVCLLAIFVRRNARQGYRPLQQNQD